MRPILKMIENNPNITRPASALGMNNKKGNKENASSIGSSFIS